MSVAPSRVSGFAPKPNGAGRMDFRAAGLQAHRPERTHPQPQGRRTRAPIIEEHDRPARTRRAVRRVGRVEDARLGLAGDVADRQRTSSCCVGNGPSADRRAVAGGNRSLLDRCIGVAILRPPPTLPNGAHRGSWPCRPTSGGLGERGRGNSKAAADAASKRRIGNFSFDKVARTVRDLGRIQLQHAIQSTNGRLHRRTD